MYSMFLAGRIASAAAALDQIHVGIELIRAIDRQIQPARLIQRGYLEAALLRQVGGARRCGDAGDVKLFLPDLLPQQLHKPGCGGACAQPDAHAVLDKAQRTHRRRFFGAFACAH